MSLHAFVGPHPPSIPNSAAARVAPRAEKSYSHAISSRPRGRKAAVSPPKGGDRDAAAQAAMRPNAATPTLEVQEASVPSTSLIPQAHQAPALKSVVPPLGLATLRVLVVEDDPELQWRLARMLTVQGHRVVGTSSGEGALALVGQWTVDIVLLDEHLPGLSGVELLRRLREAHPQLKVALMSRHPGSALQQLHVRAQVDAWIQKPLDRNALQAVLERLAQR